MVRPFNIGKGNICQGYFHKHTKSFCLMGTFSLFCHSKFSTIVAWTVSFISCLSAIFFRGVEMGGSLFLNISFNGHIHLFKYLLFSFIWEAPCLMFFSPKIYYLPFITSAHHFGLNIFFIANSLCIGINRWIICVHVSVGSYIRVQNIHKCDEQ